MAYGNAKNGRRWARIVVDAALALLFVAVMATALVQEVPHEYLGIAVFAAVVAHVVLNLRWFRALLRGRYSAVRVPQIATVVGLIVSIVGQVASSLVLSKFAFGFLPALPGAALARRVHMLCSYWSFVFAFAHAGLQLRGFGRLVRAKDMPPAAVWLARILAIAVSCYGIYAFVRMNMGAYLFGQAQYAFADFSVPIALLCVRYAAIAVLVTSVFHCVGRMVSNPRQVLGL